MASHIINQVTFSDECSELVEGLIMYTVYVLKNNAGKLYIGMTANVEKRLESHNQSRGARFTLNDPSFKLVYQEEYTTLHEAIDRERQLKGWRRSKKLALIDHTPWKT